MMERCFILGLVGVLITILTLGALSLGSSNREDGASATKESSVHLEGSFKEVEQVRTNQRSACGRSPLASRRSDVNDGEELASKESDAHADAAPAREEQTNSRQVSIDESRTYSGQMSSLGQTSSGESQGSTGTDPSTGQDTGISAISC